MWANSARSSWRVERLCPRGTYGLGGGGGGEDWGGGGRSVSDFFVWFWDLACDFNVGCELLSLFDLCKSRVSGLCSSLGEFLFRWPFSTLCFCSPVSCSTPVLPSLLWPSSLSSLAFLLSLLKDSTSLPSSLVTTMLLLGGLLLWPTGSFRFFSEEIFTKPGLSCVFELLLYVDLDSLMFVFELCLLNLSLLSTFLLHSTSSPLSLSRATTLSPFSVKQPPPSSPSLFSTSSLKTSPCAPSLLFLPLSTLSPPCPCPPPPPTPPPPATPPTLSLLLLPSLVAGLRFCLASAPLQ